jgi:hypothetical protein
LELIDIKMINNTIFYLFIKNKQIMDESNKEMIFIVKNDIITCNDILICNIPDDYYDGQTNIYSLESLFRSNLTSIPKNVLLNIKKKNEYRYLKTTEDEIIERSNEYQITLDINENNGIPNNMNTGINVDERKLLFNSISEEVDRLLRRFKESEEELNRKIQLAFNTMNDRMQKIMDFYTDKSDNIDGYQGELKDGLPDGYGKKRLSKYLDTLDYESSNNKENKIYERHSEYEGNWIKGKYHGYGKYTEYKDSTFTEIISCYEGNYVDGIKNGQGKYINYEGFLKGILEGEFTDNDIVGYAKMTYLNGDVYEGGWDCECKSGLGKMTYIDGNILECEWFENEPLSDTNNYKIKYEESDKEFNCFINNLKEVTDKLKENNDKKNKMISDIKEILYKE